MGDQERREEELERQGTVAQLLQRISELEATLLRATHFAPVEAPSDSERRASSSLASPADTAVDDVGPIAATSDPKIGDASVTAADAVATVAGGEEPETLSSPAEAEASA